MSFEMLYFELVSELENLEFFKENFDFFLKKVKNLSKSIWIEAIEYEHALLVVT
jgi:hypothetical protein